MEKDELELEKENEIPGEEKTVEEEPQSDAETGTAEGGEIDEAPAAAEESEEMPAEDNQVAPEPEPVEEEQVEEKMLTQSQVNELVGKARAEGRASVMKELYGRYGVNDDNEMNDIFGRGQGYDLLNDEYNALNGKYGNLAAENALLKTQVVPGRWDDVKAILGSKGMDVSVENIQAEMATHPEWKNVAAAAVDAQPQNISPEMAEAMAENSNTQGMPTPQVSQVRKLGSNTPEPKVDTEENNAMKWFGYK